jgi:hypothetical protein
MAGQDPLIFRLLAKSQQPLEARYEDRYKKMFNTLRRYNAWSVVDMALRLLWNKWPSKVDEMQNAPWLTLLLVKWAVRDEMVRFRIGPDIPVQVFDQLRQELWSSGGKEYEGKPAGNVWLMLRMILSTQVEFQRSANWGFLRWPALIDRTESTHRLRRMFVEEMGMEPSTFMDLAFVLYASVLVDTPPFARGHFDSLRSTYGESLEKMISLLCRDLPVLRSELRSSEACRVRGRHELYEFPYLKRFPLLRLRDGRLHCWHPLVLARGIEEAAHLRLSNRGEDYTKPFSKVFEQYVLELSAKLGGSAIIEDDYWAVMGEHAKAVEAIIPFVNCNVLIEAKMALFGEDVLLTDDPNAIHRKTKSLREGIRKAWTVGKALRENQPLFPSCASATTDYLILVTSRELYFGNGARLKDLYPSDKFAYPDDDAFGHLPLEHVFIVSIEDFENLAGAVAAGHVNLPELMREAVEANRDPAKSRMFFADFMRGKVKRWEMTDLMRTAKQESQKRIATAMGAPLDVFERDE